MKQITALAALAVALTLVANAFSNRGRPVPSAQPLLAGSAADPRTKEVLARSCANCHSEQTEWPWYSHIPPAGWLIERDVTAARGKMNLSRWEEYSAERKREILGSLASDIRNGRMPLSRYVLLHPEARMSAGDVAWIEAWTRAERRRLKQ